MSEFKFEELQVYQRSLDVLDKVYKTTKSFPKEELFVLSSQFNRACLSISLNIAEGAGSSNKNFNKYLDIASNSLKECIVCVTVANRRNYITNEENDKFREEFLVIAKMLMNLKKFLSK